MADQALLPPALAQAAPAAAGPGMLGGFGQSIASALPGGSSVMSGLDAMMGMGRGAPAMDMLGAAPPGAAAATDRVMSGDAPAGGTKTPSAGDLAWQAITGIGTGLLVPGLGPMAPEVFGKEMPKVIKDIPETFFPTPPDNSPIEIPLPKDYKPNVTPDPVPPAPPAPTPAPAPSPRKPMSGPMPEMPWFLEPAGPSTW
jgi:hypothetical protein